MVKKARLLGIGIPICISGCGVAPVVPDVTGYFEPLIPTVPMCQTSDDCPQAKLLPDLTDASVLARDLDGTWQLVRGEVDYWRQLQIEDGRVVRQLPDGPWWVGATSTTVDGDEVVFRFVGKRVNENLETVAAEELWTIRFSRVSSSELNGTYVIESYANDQHVRTLGPIATRAVRE